MNRHFLRIQEKDMETFRSGPLRLMAGVIHSSLALLVTSLFYKSMQRPHSTDFWKLRLPYLVHNSHMHVLLSCVSLLSIKMVQSISFFLQRWRVAV